MSFEEGEKILLEHVPVKYCCMKNHYINEKCRNKRLIMIIIISRIIRGGSRTAATSKMERFVILSQSVNYYQLTIITKRSILNVAAVLDPPLIMKVKINIKILYSKSFKKLCLRKKNWKRERKESRLKLIA